MDVFDALTTARAIRRFSDEPVTDEEIERCIDAAVCAPNGGNLQFWRFLVVRDADAKKRVAGIYRKSYDRYEPAMMRTLAPARSPEEETVRNRNLRASRYLADHLDEAQALVCALMPRIDMTMQDDEGPLDIGTPYASVYPAVQNFVIAARSLGIGTTLTTVYRIYQDEVRDVLGVPDTIEIVALLPLGRPRGSFSRPRRRSVDQVTYWDRYGDKRA